MQSQFLLLPAIQTIHKITNARTGYHKQSHEIKSPTKFLLTPKPDKPSFQQAEGFISG